MHIGTCGFPVAKHKYFKEFRTVEIQKTFYTPITPSLVIKWKNEAPKDFIFTLKAPQTITHPPKSPTYRRYKAFMGDFGYFKNNSDVMRSWEAFLHIVDILKPPVIVFQSPSSFRENVENIRNIFDFFNSIERVAIYGWEPRGKWNENTVRKICSELDLIHVVDPFISKKVWGEISYYRLHGIGGYKYKYKKEELERLKGWINSNDFVMFNNTNMWEDALRFKFFIEENIIRE